MDECIRAAVKSDIPALCNIWERCFSDSRDYIELFYRNNFERLKVLAVYKDNTPVSAVHLIDAVLKDANNSQAAKFIYATGTLPEYRNKGCMSALIRRITDTADKSGRALFLKPATASTAEFYGSFGFNQKAYFDLVSITPSGTKPIEAHDLPYSDYNRMREAELKDVPHVKWDDAHIKWCAEENGYFSGKTLIIKYDNKDYYLLGYPEGNTLVINETDLPFIQLKEISCPLCNIFKAEQIKAYMPYLTAQGEKTVSSLLYNSQINNPYINMIMI